MILGVDHKHPFHCAFLELMWQEICVREQVVIYWLFFFGVLEEETLARTWETLLSITALSSQMLSFEE